jgi:hypothetical protein
VASFSKSCACLQPLCIRTAWIAKRRSQRNRAQPELVSASLTASYCVQTRVCIIHASNSGYTHMRETRTALDSTWIPEISISSLLVFPWVYHYCIANQDGFIWISALDANFYSLGFRTHIASGNVGINTSGLVAPFTSPNRPNRL